MSELALDLFNAISEIVKLRKRIAELKESDKHWAGNVKVCMQLIERYESAIAELEEKQRWRVVADGELPEFGTSILFYDSILEKINKGTCTALDRDKTNLQWITDDGLYYHGNRCEYITHWMPLPQLPEVQRQ